VFTSQSRLSAQFTDSEHTTLFKHSSSEHFSSSQSVNSEHTTSFKHSSFKHSSSEVSNHPTSASIIVNKKSTIDSITHNNNLTISEIMYTSAQHQ